jgi:predicted DNA-binding protein
VAFLRGKQVLTSVYLDPEIHKTLKLLSAETGIPMARLIRDGIMKVLEEHGVKVARNAPRRTIGLGGRRSERI